MEAALSGAAFNKRKVKLNSSLYNFTIIFLGIFLEALPFVMIGMLLSSLFEVFIPPDHLKRFLKGKLFSYFLIGGAAFFFPICECAIVPVARRLVKKGMPAALAITFMLAAPTVNFVVLLSTRYAFVSSGFYPVMRFLSGYTVAVLSGLMFSYFAKERDCFKEESALPVSEESCSCCHSDEKNSILYNIIFHTSRELYDVGRYLIVGASLSAFVQVYVPIEKLRILGMNPVLGIVILMGLAFLLSLCSEADAFVAATFQGRFLPSAILSFMVFGPMVDMKNILMLASVLKRRYLLLLAGIVSILSFLLHLTLGFLIV